MALFDYKPKVPSEYTEPQIVLNSDRIIFNAKKDSIFLNSNKSISIASNGTINFDVGKYVIVNSPKNYLGINSVDETEPAVLGGQLKDFFTDILDLFDDIAEDFKDAYVSTEGGKLTMINMAGKNLETRSKDLRQTLPTLFSKITYLE